MSAQVRELAPEDDGFVAYCDLRVGDSDSYRVQAPAWVLRAQLDRVARSESPTAQLRIEGYDLVIGPQLAASCVAEPVEFTDEERELYHQQRADWLAGRRQQYPTAPLRLVDEQSRLMFPPSL